MRAPSPTGRGPSRSGSRSRSVRSPGHHPGILEFGQEVRMRTLIKGGTIVNADATTSADVLVDGEVVELIGRDLDIAADRTIDASGKWVIPGAIDIHTHMELPFG